MKINVSSTLFPSSRVSGDNLLLREIICKQTNNDKSRTHQVCVYRDRATPRKRVNQYEVVDKINHGVHGKVKLAYNRLTNAEVALKVIRRASRDAIRREIAVLKRVHHTNIISCREVIDDLAHPKVYVVLEYAEIGRLPWRRRGQDHVCRYEWERTQVGMKLRGAAETTALRDSLDSQGARVYMMAPANQRLDVPTCESPITHASSVEGDEQSLSLNESPHCLDTNVNNEPFSDHFQYVPCITIEQARRALLDVVSGLECLHAHGIVHRDIKPDNLLWTLDYRVKICDFSTSFVGPPSYDTSFMSLSSTSDGRDLTLFDGDNEMMRTIGTPGFIAPELCCIRPDSMDLKTFQQVDIWSLGVTLYCLAFARVPFVADDEYQLYRKMAKQDVYVPTQRLLPVPPSDSCAPMMFSTGQYRRDDTIQDEHLDKELLDLLHRMLTRNAEKRIRLAEIKTHPWLRVTSAEYHNSGTPKKTLDGQCGIGAPSFP